MMYDLDVIEMPQLKNIKNKNAIWLKLFINFARDILRKVIFFLPFNPTFRETTAPTVDEASCPMEFSSEPPPPDVKRSPINDI